MGKLDYAIEELKASGWTTLDPSGCVYTPEGAMYPGLERVKRDFDRTGHSLRITRTELFDCWRAEWADQAGSPIGSVVGQSEEEAAVYALAQLRRMLARGPIAS